MFILFGVTFYCYCFSLSAKAAKTLKLSLLTTGAAGALICILSLLTFFISLSSSAADLQMQAVIKNSFTLFLISDSVFVAIGLLITLLSSFTKSVLRPLIPVVLPMWAAISLFWTAAFTVWSVFPSFDSSGTVIAFGIGSAAILAFSALPQMVEREKILNDPEKRKEIIRTRREKKAKAEAKRMRKRNLREKKRRLRHPKK
ncbi:MAG: hypothetical protein E7647_08360 [Ruminococcaceae bacterium]|nr:hypothetical protein [Oscillospiraceae bacterium]